MKKYFLGIDVGTSSVGWCVTDEDCKIVKKGGKSLWGVTMFEEAQSAQSRRQERTARKTLNRRNERIELLRMLFAEEMHKTDETFFQRLDDSFYYQEDRKNKNFHTLFTEGYTDRDFFKEFPTPYHLRKSLIENDKKADLRLLFLCINHMLKKRGHFLNNCEEFKLMDQDELNESICELKENLTTFFENTEDSEIGITFASSDYESLKRAFHDNKGKKDRKNAINEILNKTNNKIIKDIIVAFLSGSEINLKKIECLNLESDVKLEALMDEFESKVEEAKNQVGAYEEFFNALICCKKIFDFFYLGKLLKSDSGQDSYLYKAMIKRYDEHREDLKALKDFIKKYNPNKKFECFKSQAKIANYANYVGNNKIKNKKLTTTKKVSKDDFYKYLKKEIFTDYIKCDESDLEKDRILAKIDEGEFLNKTVSSVNSIYPYQLNLIELKMILNTQAKYHEFLNKVEDNILIKDKIISLLTFKIPYYVGPLNNKSDKAWIVRSNKKIYPWTFDSVVDVDKSAEEFIKRMLNKCTYLKDCYCLPTNSLVFSYYNVLSFINKIYVNGCYLKKDEKNKIITELYMKNRKVSKKDLINYFKTVYGQDVKITTSTEKDLQEINSNLSSHYDFAKLFSEDFVKKNQDVIEQLINDITVFEDKKILEKRILKEPKYAIFRDKIKAIKGLTYKGYGRISGELLTKLISQDENGVTSGSILDIMVETNQNLQDILFNQEYGFEKQIIEYNSMKDTEYKSIEEFINNEVYVSPIMKRSLLQSCKLIDEVEKILKEKISTYYIECTRTNQAEKKNSKSRKQKMTEMLEEVKRLIKDKQDLMISTKEVDSIMQICKGLDEKKFNSDKYYLYFMQLGRCMYTLNPINFDDIDKPELYDVDHIIPQALFKDDSFSNRVLTCQDINKQKSNTYPIPLGLLHKDARKFYKMMKDKGFISDRKYDSLIKRELSEADLNRFINRQLVATNQAVTGLVKTLKEFKGVRPTDIVFSKAENVSDFRQKFDILKSRSANNFHHAHDAYLNIVAGRAIHKYFERNFIRNKEDITQFNAKGITTNPMKIFKEDGYPETHFMRKYWNKEILEKVKKNIYERFDILTTTRTYCKNDLLSKVTILPSFKNTDKNANLFSVKPTNVILSKVEKYGGLANYSYSFYTLVKAVVKKNTEYIIVPIPKVFENNIYGYLTDNCGYAKEVQIIIERLKINTVIEDGAKKYCITGATGNQFTIKNLKERHFNKNEIATIRLIDKYNNEKNNKKDIFVKTADEIVIIEARTAKNKKHVLNQKKLDETFRTIVEVFSKKEYMFSGIKTLLDKIEETKFFELKLEDKVHVVSELLKLLKCNERKTCDLTLLGLSENCGTLLIPNKVKLGMKIVYESVTGFYRKTVWEHK